MKYLSGMDNLFLSQETTNQHMHVGGLGIYNPSTAEGGFVRFKAIIDFFTERLSAAAVFRRCIARSIVDMDRPFWVEDPDVDVEYHVRHMALPEPSDWRQLMIQIARIHSRPMDLSKPLWEAYIIEGLDNIEGLPSGSFALYLKFHHCAVDGEAAAHLIGTLHTLKPEYKSANERAAGVNVTQRHPHSMEIISRSMARRVEQLKNVGDMGGSVANYALKNAKQALSGGAENIKQLLKGQNNSKKKVPATRFNGPISPHRVLDAVGISLTDCAEIRNNVGDGTVNDVFLTVVGGALRDYLIAHGEAPSGSLMGAMPMTLRGEDKSGDEGNQIAQAYYDLHSDIVDPLQRLAAIKTEIDNLKLRMTTGLGKDFQARLLEILPAELIAKQLTREVGLSSNANVSNVRGPSQTLYMAGARLERFIPFSLILEGSGLNITGFSYNGILWAAVTCCRDMMPDPEFFSECLAQSVAELKAAAHAHARAKSGDTSGKRGSVGRVSKAKKTAKSAKGVKQVAKAAPVTTRVNTSKKKKTVKKKALKKKVKS